MGNKDEQIRKNMDELNTLKARVAALTRKDTGNLNQRDFMDDIYQKKGIDKCFISNTEMFQDILIVVNNDKFESFQSDLVNMMPNYF